MKIIHWTAVNLVLLLVGLSHLCDARLDFWNGKEHEQKPRVNDLNPNKFSPVIFSKCFN